MLIKKFRSKKSQSMIEFALVAPILLLMIFGFVDFGRAIYFFLTIQEATSDGARAAVAYTTPLPTDSKVDAAVKNYAIAAILANPCKNGPISGTPSANTGYIYITDVNPSSTPESTQPTPYNAPGGDVAAASSGGCSAINPGSGNIQLQVTIRYTYVPLTPILANAVGSSIILTAKTTYRTEY